LSGIRATARRRRRSKFPNQEIPQEHWNPRSSSVKNPRSSNKEEEEIEIPKSRNSSRTLRTWAAAARRRRRSKFPNQEIPQLTWPPLLQSTPYTSTTDQLHREQAVIGRIFQALPTQTDTTVALIYRILACVHSLGACVNHSNSLAGSYIDRCSSSFPHIIASAPLSLVNL
jgi:hypothetical protein